MGGSKLMIDVYIRYLRKKLDDGFDPKLIHTVREAVCAESESSKKNVGEKK